MILWAKANTNLTAAVFLSETFWALDGEAKLAAHAEFFMVFSTQMFSVQVLFIAIFLRWNQFVLFIIWSEDLFVQLQRKNHDTMNFNGYELKGLTVVSKNLIWSDFYVHQPSIFMTREVNKLPSYSTGRAYEWFQTLADILIFRPLLSPKLLQITRELLLHDDIKQTWRNLELSIPK